MTDQPTLTNRLAKAMTRVAEAEHHISAQASRVEALEQARQDAGPSLTILATLREAHFRFQQEVEHILKEMKRNSHP